MEKTAFKLMFNKSRTMVLEIQNNIAGYCKNTFFFSSNTCIYVLLILHIKHYKSNPI